MDSNNFVPINGFEDYLINPYGIIIGKRFKRPLTYFIHRDGYLKTSLFAKGKRKWFFVHRLVAINFIDCTNEYAQVNHKDGDKQNNNVSNLEWCTASENVKHSFDILGKRPNKTKSMCVVGIDLSNNNKVYFDSISNASIYSEINHSYLSKRLREKYNKPIKGFMWQYAGCE